MQSSRIFNTLPPFTPHNLAEHAGIASPGASQKENLGGRITVGYGSVHQAFQLALAAHEMGCLDVFLCSFYSQGWRIGALVDRLSGGSLHNRRLEGLHNANIKEHPHSFLLKQLLDILKPGRQGWLAANEHFDRWMARQFAKNPSHVFVGTETCDLYTLQTAKKLGSTTIHDCPQVHPGTLRRLMQEAAEAAELPLQQHLQFDELEDRKLREYEIADYLLVYSDLHRLSFEQQGFGTEQIFQCPLWVNTEFWHNVGQHKPPQNGRLRVLFAGTIGLRKGIPFLLKAFDQCKNAVELTLVGAIEPVMEPIISRYRDKIHLTGRLSKQALRDLYPTYDVFVLPSVVDSFGFVALEAMACGLPVIASTHCGAPIPDAWRIPPMNATVIAQQLLFLAENRAELTARRAAAIFHSRQFTPERYRANIQGFYRQFMD